MKFHAISDEFLATFPAWAEAIKKLNLISLYNGPNYYRVHLCDQCTRAGKGPRCSCSVWPRAGLGSDNDHLVSSRQRAEASFQNLIQQAREKS